MSDDKIVNDDQLVDAEFGDAVLAPIEEATALADEAGVFCGRCVKKIDTGRRPVDFCSTCNSVVRIWLCSIIERNIAAMAAEQPGRFTITNEGGKTLVKRHW